VVDGVTVNGEPVPTEVPPPHDPAYHVHAAPTPKLPPFTVSVTGDPAVTVSDVEVIEVGEVLAV